MGAYVVRAWTPDRTPTCWPVAAHSTSAGGTVPFALLRAHRLVGGHVASSDTTRSSELPINAAVCFLLNAGVFAAGVFFRLSHGVEKATTFTTLAHSLRNAAR